MKSTVPLDSFNGKYAEVAAFLRVSERTVRDWKANEEIGYWQHGDNITIGEDDVIEEYVRYHHFSKTMTSEERKAKMAALKEDTRKKWREHLQIAHAGELTEFLHRLDLVERKLKTVEAATSPFSQMEIAER